MKYILIAIMSLSLTMPFSAHSQMVVSDPGGYALDAVSIAEETITAVESVWQGIKDVVLVPVVKSLGDAILNKLTEKTLNWANGGFNGDPGFINNWDDFLKGTEYDSIAQSFAQASNVANSLVLQTGGGNPADTAQQNWELYQSGQLNTSRDIASIIATTGVNRLNYDPLTSLINQEGETLTELLGSSQAKEEFKSDFSAGGWLGYLALVDPNNTELGTASLTQAAVNNQADAKVESKIEDVQTSERFLDKTECTEYAADGSCAREETVTPGPQVSSSVNQSIGKEQQQVQLSDELISLLIQGIGTLTSGLLEDGLNSLGGGDSGGSFFNASSLNNLVQGGVSSQSQYDVLGIENDGFIDSATPTIIVGPGLGYSGPEGFIGGPEDNAQITINLEELLEKNILLSDEEQSYFDRIDLLNIGNKETAIGIDQCLPGPDYNWEERFIDRFPTFGDSEENQKNAVALLNTRDMFTDTKTNIPGLRELYETFDAISSDTQRNQSQDRQRKEALYNVITTLAYIRDEVLQDFNAQKLAISEHLVLFISDWEELTEAQQNEVLTIAIQNQYYLLEDGETSASVLASDNERAGRAVISMGWNLWRSETPPERKNEIRYSMYTIFNDLSTEQFIALVKSRYNILSAETQQSKDILSDCLVFRLYAFGVDEPEIALLVEAGDIEGMKDHSAFYYNFPSSSGNGFGNPFNSVPGFSSASIPTPVFLATGDVRTDEEIKAFLEEQYGFYIDGLPSTPTLFKTNVMISPFAISQSILGFETEVEKTEYFDGLYPDDELNFPYIKNATSVLSILKYDRFKYGTGLRGTLFCRVTSIFHYGSLLSSGTSGSRCLNNWYIASDLDYEVGFAGI